MKMFISTVAAKLNISKANKSKLNKKRTSLEKAYGKTLLSCKTNEDINEWHLKEDPYMAELFSE